MKRKRNIAAIFGVVVLSSFMSSSLFGQTPAIAAAQSSSFAASQRVLALVDDYNASSDTTKANVARRIANEVRPLRNDPSVAPIVLARADAVLSQQAAKGGRKELALRLARNAHATAMGITTPEGRAVRARVASALAQALLLKENYVEAISVTTEARRAFGSVENNADPAIDELEMWDYIVRLSTPPRLASQVRAVAIPQNESDALSQAGNRECAVAGKEIERNKQVGVAPIFPVVSMLRGIGGGAVTRSSVDATGKVTGVVTTTYSPSEGFAAAAERAVVTWQYEVPVGVSDVCRTGLRTIFAFGFE